MNPREPSDAADSATNLANHEGPTGQAAPPNGSAAPETPVPRSRAGGMIVGWIIAAIVLILVIIFVAQNGASVTLRYFGWHGTTSLAVALLAALVAGILVVAIPAGIRLLQLRRQLRKARRQ